MKMLNTKAETAPELFPCPFCGGQAAWGEGEQKTKYGNEQVYCSDCCAITAPEGSYAEAAQNWNDRMWMPAPVVSPAPPTDGTKAETVMTQADREQAHALKNEFLVLCLNRKVSVLVALSAAECAAECFESLINEQGGDVFTVDSPSDTAALVALREALQKIVDCDALCTCEHDTEFCCAKVNEYCAFCIAATALALEKEK